MGFLFRNAVYAGFAYQEAGLAAHVFTSIGWPAALLVMIFICLTNDILGRWFKGEHTC